MAYGKNRALGDYIHYHKSNYEKFGINTGSKKGDNNYGKKQSDIAAEFKQDILSMNMFSERAKKVEYIEKEYNRMFYQKNNFNILTNFEKALDKIANEYLTKEFGFQAGSIGTNLDVIGDKSLGDAASLARKQLAKKKKISENRIKIDYIEKSNKVKTVQSKLKLLISILNKLKKSSSLAQFEKEIEDAKKNVNDIKKNIDKQLKNGNINYQISDTDIETLNNIIKIYDRHQLPSNQSGEMFEQIAPFIEIKNVDLAQEEIEKQMRNILSRGNQVYKGSNNVNLTVMPDTIEKRKNSNELIDVKIDGKNIKMKTVSVRNKTDVQISYTNEKGEQETSLASLKNISDIKSENIKIVDGTTLYNILQYFYNTEFGTHYLNVVTNSTSSNKDTKAKDNEVIEANRLLKALIMKIGLEGYDQANKPEILVINDKKTGQIKVYDIKTLIQLIGLGCIYNTSNYSSAFSGITDTMKISQSQMTGQGSIKDSKQARIEKVLADIKKKKISAFINFNMLNKYAQFVKNIP